MAATRRAIRAVRACGDSRDLLLEERRLGVPSREGCDTRSEAMTFRISGPRLGLAKDPRCMSAKDPSLSLLRSPKLSEVRVPEPTNPAPIGANCGVEKKQYAPDNIGAVLVPANVMDEVR